MGVINRSALDQLCSIDGANPELQSIREAVAGGALEERIEAYQKAVPLLERELWRDGIDDERLSLYQAFFRELEDLFALRGEDDRHGFLTVIPVADRPQHLDACLTSLLELCRLYDYGGRVDGRYRKVSVLIADDSKGEESIVAHRAIAERFTAQGLEVVHLDQSEQRALVESLGDEARSSLTGVVGKHSQAYFHKGASITRNIAYLKIRGLLAPSEQTLVHFIDSDQEFRVNVEGPDGERALYAVNYLYHLDRIFREREVSILTGKVVGDPPVAPAVMAGNFLDDVIAFLVAMSEHPPTSACTLHGDSGQRVSDAAYHDMADLFGFKPAVEAYHYHCTLSGVHNHAACLTDFACKLGRFFDGEHPTRKSLFEPADLDTTLQAARTIYTGNYTFSAEALEYFIPFATLKLRMAGPVLGRIIKGEIGGRFLSANLPMLHKRTVAESGRSEFRPGIEREGERVELHGEFERQYFGDVMLFTMERLTAQGYPNVSLSEAVIAEVVDGVEAEMFDKYGAKQRLTAEKIDRLERLFSDPSRWWNRQEDLDEARDGFLRFIDNMAHNFGADSHAYRLIRDADHRAARKAAIRAAIGRYRDERRTWRGVLERNA